MNPAPQPAASTTQGARLCSTVNAKSVRCANWDTATWREADTQVRQQGGGASGCTRSYPGRCRQRWMLQGRSYKLRIVAPARCIPSGGVFRCAALRIRTHTAGAVFKPTRGVLLLPLVGVVGGSSCFSNRGLKTTGGTGLRNRAAQRCSSLL
jgi:hypothetical protein